MNPKWHIQIKFEESLRKLRQLKIDKYRFCLTTEAKKY